MTNPQSTKPTDPGPPERQFMQSVTIPLQAPNPPVGHKRFMTEFRIDYQTRRGSNGRDFVYKVLLPSAYKGYAIMVEKKDSTSPSIEGLPLEISREAEKSVEEYQRSSAENIRDVQVQVPKRSSIGQMVTEPEWLAKFNKVNGVVSPSLLEPGQPPVKNPWAGRRKHASINAQDAQVRNGRCPICDDWYPRVVVLKNHFVHCVHRNGNPQGLYWDGRLNDERRIGKQIAELYCTRVKEWDLDSETSTSDSSSDHSYHTCRYEPSQSCSDNESSSSRSLAATPSSSHDRNYYTGSSPQNWVWTDDGEGNGVSERCDQIVADWDLEPLQISVAGRAERRSEAAQAQPSEQLPDPQAHTLSLKHEARVEARDWITVPETPVHHDSKAHVMEASGYDSIQGDFDAGQPMPKTAAPTLTGQGHDTIGNAYSLPTPLSAKDFIARRSPGLSAGGLISPLAGPANDANRLKLRPLLPSPLSGAKKHRIPSEISPLAQGPKRQRRLLSEPANLPQVKTIAGSSSSLEKQIPQFVPVLPECSALSLSRNGPIFREKKDVNNVDVRQTKGAELRINTQAAELAVPLPPRTEPTHGEKLFAGYVKTHKVLRGELDELSHEFCAANERAKMAQLRAQKAENMEYQANSASFYKLKELEDHHRADLQIQGRKYKALKKKFEKQQRGFEILEKGLKALDQTIEEVKGELKQERERRVR